MQSRPTHGSLLLPQTLNHITGSVPYHCTRHWAALCGTERQCSVLGCFDLHRWDLEQYPRILLPEYHITFPYMVSQLLLTKGKWFSMAARGGVSGDGSCSVFQKHKAFVHAHSNNSFTWSKLGKGRKNVVHGRAWDQVAPNRKEQGLPFLQEVVTLAQLSFVHQVRADIVLCHLGCKFLAEALLYCSMTLEAICMLKFLPLLCHCLKLLILVKLRVSQCTSLKTRGQALWSSSTPFFAEVWRLRSLSN